MKFFLLLIFSLSISLAAQQNQNDLFSTTNRLKFGNKLYNDKDYLRAINEYKEVLRENSNDTIMFRFANSFLKIGRYDEAAQNFKTLFAGSKFIEESKFLFYEANFLKNDFQAFHSLYESKIYFPQKYSRNVEQLNSISYFLDKSPLPKENDLLKPFDDSIQTRLANFYQRKKNPELKSPETAAVFSAIIPGAGKIYSGELTDGLIALGATALSAFLAINNFQNDHQFRGWLFTGLTAFFYGGSIYGSYSSAQVYNARLRINLDNEIKVFFESKNYFLPSIDF